MRAKESSQQAGKPMRIILSWSESLSRAIADELHEWLPTIFGKRITTWVSTKDINAGSRWQEELLETLRDAHMGVLCLTSDNTRAPWILFEAGLLGKEDQSKVIPYLFEITQLESPLSLFQHVSADRTGTLKLVKGINRALRAQGLEEGALNKIFNQRWPSFEKKRRAAIEQVGAERATRRSAAVCKFLESFVKDCEPPLVPGRDRQDILAERSYRLLRYMFQTQEVESFSALDLALFRWDELLDESNEQVVNMSRHIMESIEGMMESGRCKKFRRILVLDQNQFDSIGAQEILKQFKKHEIRIRSKNAPGFIETRYLIFNNHNKAGELILRMRDFVLFDDGAASFAVVEEALTKPAEAKTDVMRTYHTIYRSDADLSGRRDGFDYLWKEAKPVADLFEERIEVAVPRRKPRQGIARRGKR